MTDEEKDKLIVEALGEYWDEPEFLLGRKPIPNLTTWEGFGWLWERAQKMEWWNDFIDYIVKDRHYPITWRSIVAFSNRIHPTRFKDALAEFLEGRK